MDSQLFFQLLLAEMSVRSDDVSTGFQLMLDAARKTQDESAYRRAVQMALQARSGDSALQASKAWSSALPQSREANRYLCDILIGLGRLTEVQEPLRKDIQLALSTDRKAAVWGIPDRFERVKNTSQSAQLVQRALAPWANDASLGPTVWATQARMWVAAGDTAAALNAASQGLGLGAAAEHPAQVALDLMERAAPQAESLVRKHLPQARPEFRLAYVRTLLNLKRSEDARAQLQSLLDVQPPFAPAWLLAGALALQDNQLETAQTQLQRYLVLTQSHQTEQGTDVQRGRNQAFFALAQVASQRKDDVQAEQWLAQVNGDSEQLQVAIARAGLMSRQGQLDEALNLIDQAPQSSHQDVRLKRSVSASLLREHKQWARAKAVLQEGLAQDPGDFDALYDLAMVSEKLGELDNMERQLRTLMDARPQDPQAFNALGYALADRNQRLGEARELIQKALSLAPQDPFIIDSLGWVEYRMGHLDEAQRLLRQAYDARADAEIAAHLGEVLWMQNQKEQAIALFRQAQQHNAANATLQETLQRLHVSW
jgi:tetratricopeptide (TPR) repeat protein